MSKAKNIIIKIVNVISVIIIIVAVLLLVLALLNKKQNKIPSLFGYSAFRVLTGSMEPTYPTGTMVIVKQTDPAEIKEGDVISFYSADPELQGAINTHRVIEIQNDGRLLFITRGDANASVDEYPVYGSSLVGKVVGQSKAVGFLAGLISKPYIFFPIIIIPLVVIFALNIKDAVKLSKTIEKEEEAKALEETIKALKKNQENIEKAKAKSEADIKENEDECESRKENEKSD